METLNIKSVQFLRALKSDSPLPENIVLFFSMKAR